MNQILEQIRKQEEKDATFTLPTSPEELLSELIRFGGEKQGLIDKSKFVFRGQANADWKLVSKLGRKAVELPGTTQDRYSISQLEGVYTEHFVRNAKLFQSNLPPLNDKIAWLMLMQHHGAPTRLLDWTWSPFVALFMALAEEKPKEVKQASLYILNYRSLSLYWNTELWDIRGPAIWGDPPRTEPEFPYLISKQAEEALITKAIHDNSEYLPIPLRPRNAIQRYRSQQALVTVTITNGADIPEGKDLGPRRGKHDNVTGAFLQKIDFPRTWRKDILRHLSGMGISYSTMFPTLDGLGAETAAIRSFSHQS